MSEREHFINFKAEWTPPQVYAVKKTGERTRYVRADLATPPAPVERVRRLERMLTEALIKVENDRTLRTDEWLIWLYDARATLAPEPTKED